MATETLTVTQEFTTLDLLLWRRFLNEQPLRVEKALDSNQGIGAMGPYLDVGTKVVIELPDPQAATQVVRIVRLTN